MNQHIEMLHKALSKFEKSTGLKVIYIDSSRDPIDQTVEIIASGSRIFFDAEVKATINSVVIGQFKQKSHIFRNSPLLITYYVTPEMFFQIQSLNINFIDTAGNAYINTPNLMVQYNGFKPEEPRSSVKRLFRTSGLKTLFALLSQPALENSDYREIATMANVSLGSVAWVIQDLKQSGYIVTFGKTKIKLLKKDELLNKWVVNYHDQLKPKLFLGQYSSLIDDWMKNNKNSNNFFIGSESAAGIITGYLKSNFITIYVDELKNEFLITNKFHRTKDGNIAIFKKFWHFNDDWSKKNVVPPLLVYADLIGSQSDRNIETAKIIYEKELSKLIK